ncbi:plasma kallikrein-like isoform X2 [Elgaria multicarinata webbii]|uniref:plasma kallikrein-like isoform X2 n=1 Tax=Elgaria multicarinata webbii TaxID=159646 RepID=UPI002FCCDB69
MWSVTLLQFIFFLSFLPIFGYMAPCISPGSKVTTSTATVSRMAWISQIFYFIMLLSSVRSECVYRDYKNTYLRGGDIAKVYTPNAEVCRIVCTYHSRCLLYSYMPGNWPNDIARFSCFLKEAAIQELPKIPMQGVISGHSRKQCPRITACTKNIFEGLDIKGENYNVTTADSYHSCQKRCTNENHCQFFTYSTTLFHRADLRNKCYLKYSSTGMPTSIRELTNVISGFSLKACQLAETDCKMDVFQNQVFSGIAVAKVFAPHVFACRIICTYHPNCLFFTFHSGEWEIKSKRYTCQMMTSRSGMPDAITERLNAMSGFSILNCRRTTPACHFPTHPNLNFLGTELSEEYISGPEACQQLCTDTVRCQFFTYASSKTLCNPEGKCKCYLRMTANGSPNNIEPKHGYISGYSLRLCQTKDIAVCVQEPRMTRIVGGINSSLGEWPWQVSLHVKLTSYSHLCGGTIISDQWIVTAAHCVEELNSPEYWRVYSGILKQSEIRDDTSFFNVKQMIVHSEFRRSEEGSDIALMKLDRPMNFSVLEQPACLPSKEEINTRYTECWVTGWGYRRERGQVEDVLQKVKIPLITNVECQSLYPQYHITDKMICAGYREGGRDACKGDSGGPLHCKHLNTWYLVGITSWGEGCARPGQPGVYTDVAKYLDWILENMS